MGQEPLFSSPLKVVIPTRFDSTRLPGKPLVDLGGIPMIQRVYDRVTLALPDSEVLVATDDSPVLEYLIRSSVPHVVTSSSHVSGTDRVAEVARVKNWTEDTLVLNVQGDEPLIPVSMLSGFANFLVASGDFGMATVVTPLGGNRVADPSIVKVVASKTGRAIYFSRAPIPCLRDGGVGASESLEYLQHVGVYAYRNGALQQLTSHPACELEQREKLEQLRALWMDLDIQLWEFDQVVPGGVDTWHDVLLVRRFLEVAADEH